MAFGDRSESRGRSRNRRPRKPPPPRPTTTPTVYVAAPKVPPRHTQPTGVFRNPVTPGPALHQQQKAQREQVRHAEARLPGPVLRLPRFPTLRHYTPAQRQQIIMQTSSAIRDAVAKGHLDSYLATRKGEEMLYDRLGHLADPQTRRAVHKLAGALQTRQRHLDILLGRQATAHSLLPVPPTLANLADIGRRVREQQLATATANAGEISPYDPSNRKTELGSFLDSRVFNYAPGLRVLKVPAELAQATVEDPIGVAKESLRTGIESIAGIPQGVKALIDDPKAALKAMGEDYSHRYGPLLEGNDAKFRKQVQQESGLTPFAFDAATVGAGGGRVLGAIGRAGATGRAAEALAAAGEPVLSRILKAAHDTATMERPNLRFSGGEGGVRPQATSRNLLVAGGQRALDQARRRKFTKTAESAGLRQAADGSLERIPGTEIKRLPGLRPGANEVLPHYSLREAPPVRRLTGRVATDIGHGKSKARLQLLTQRARVLQEFDKSMRHLGPEERAALMPMHKYGLPAVVDEASKAAALRAIDRRLAILKRNRKAAGFRGVAEINRATNDEVALLRTIRKDPERYLTPQLRKSADQFGELQRFTEQIDPGISADQASIRANTEQGKLLGVHRGPDEQHLRNVLQEIELVRQARGRGPGGVTESHGRLAAMLPDERPAAATNLEQQAKARLSAAERNLAKAREAEQYQQAVAEGLSRSIGGLDAEAAAMRAGKDVARLGRRGTGRPLDVLRYIDNADAGRYAGGGHGVAQAREAVRAAEEARNAARDAYQAAQDVTRAVKSKSNMRLESAQEFDARVKKAAEEAGLSDPGYWMSTPRPTETYSSAAVGSGGRGVAGTRRYTGALSDIGIETHTPEVLLQGMERNVKRRFSWALVSGNVETHALEWSRGAHGEGMTASELLRYMDAHAIDGNSLSFINTRVVRKRPPEEEGLVRGAVSHQAAEDTTLADAHAELTGRNLAGEQVGGDPGRVGLDFLKHEDVQGLAMNRYLAMPKEAADELQAATRPDGAFARSVEIILKQKPSRILLGLANVPWMMFQIASNALLTGLGGAVNPLDVYGAHKWWRGLTPGEKDAVEIELGISHGRHFALDQPMLGSTKQAFGPAEHWINFWQAYKKSKVGRYGPQTAPRHLMDLMFAGDEAQNNFFRKVLFYNKAKKAAYREMGANWHTLDGVYKKTLSALAVPPEKLGGAIVKHGPDFERAAKAVNDFLGNYLKFSNRERELLSRNVMFYGYLRFSLRFAFWTMPVEHPIMTNILSNIGRMGSDEIKKLFGVPRNYRLPTSMLANVYWGATPEQVKEYVASDGQKGKLPQTMPLSIGRANPALNALTQMEGAQQVVGLVSPLYQLLADQMFNESSFSGRDFRIKGQTPPSESERPKNYYGSFWSLFVPGSPRNRIALADLLGMAYPYRLATKTGIPGVVAPLEGPQSDDSLLWSPRPMQYKDPQIKASIARSIQRENANGAHDLLPQLIPFAAGQETTAPLIVARERQKEADAANKAMGKKKRRKSSSSSSGSSYSYGGGSSSSYKSRYGG